MVLDDEIGLIDHDMTPECGIMKSLANGHQICVVYSLNIVDTILQDNIKLWSMTQII